MAYKIILSISDGLIFSFFAIGLFVAFKWLKFPDLTPDGSFATGACLYVKLTSLGVSPYASLFIAALGGSLAGVITSVLNKTIRIPAFIAGLLMANALYSLNWLILNKPNGYVSNEQMLIQGFTGESYIYVFIFLLIIMLGFLLVILTIFSRSFLGLRLRAIGENNQLGEDLNANTTVYYMLGLGLSNGLIGLSGALFVQRSYSASINMGIGQTIIGLIGMIIGLLIVRTPKSLASTMFMITLGMIMYRISILIVLELGVPPELFRMISSIFLVLLFVLISKLNSNILGRLRWI